MRIGYVVATPEVSTAKMPAVQGKFGDILAMLRDLGYDGVELAVRDPGALDQKDLPDTLKGSGTTVFLVGTAPIAHQEGLYLCHADHDVRKAALERFRQVIAFAASLGSPVNVGSFRGSLLGGEMRERSEGWMHDALLMGADYAGEKGIRLFLEPHHRFSTNFINTAKEALAFLDASNHEAMGLMLDTFHMNIEEASIPGSVFLARGRIDYIHVADNNRRYPGAGHIPFGEFIRALQATGYTGCLTAQITQWPDPATASRRSIDHLRSLL
jgi:sugar phosphate isomerase/epimerase